MPDLTSFEEHFPVKMLLVGDSGSGKTGALASLAEAGYELFIIDFDAGIDYLANRLRGKPEAKKVHFRTSTDKMKSAGGKVIPDGMPRAFADALAFATHWKEEGFDAGPLSSWKPNRVLIWDSLTFSGHAALRYILALNGRMGQHPQIQDWGQAMAMLEDLLSLLYSEQVKCNVVITSHITYVEQESGGVSKGYPMALGSKLPPKVGRYFNTMVLARSSGSGTNAKRIIKTASEPLIELKTPVVNPPAELPLDTGLATLFRLIRGASPNDPIAKPST